MKNQNFKVFILLVLFSLAACSIQKPQLPTPVDILHQNQEKLTEVIIYDVFTPPVASRLYVYTSLASYEAIRFNKSDAPSITARLRGFGEMPVPEKGKDYDFTLAATKAFFNTVRNVKVFSVDSLTNWEESVYKGYQNVLNPETWKRSVDFGDSVAAVILRRAQTDGYLASRGKPKFLGSNEPGKWRPTPPDYLDGVEWCWNTMKTMVLDSAALFKPLPPPAYSLDTTSIYYKGLIEVYNINRNMTPEQKDIARFWDDNPFVIEHAGHMMFGNKKITPGGHWMGIAAIAARQSGADEVKTAKTYAYTALALYEGFISCWDEKYRSNFVRPVTVINEHIDHNWLPFLQTPPFPEYTSGHSTISASAAAVLTALYGDNFAFLDTSDLKYIGMQREFKSFNQAASESSVSRVYGGIHYRFTADISSEQGKKVGSYIIEKLGY